ncbi:MAG: hypothetical protein FWC43_00790 [Planctomycetaceae bacterium]|nr:hypothetical protein [Planctomycetaceae bacterium]
MTKREKQLLLIAGVLAFLVLIPLLYSLYGGTSSRVFQQRNVLREEVRKLEQAVEKKAEIRKKLADYVSQSLPQGAMIGERYSNHISDLARQSGFQNLRLTSSSPGASSAAASRTNRSSGFQTFSYKLTGNASLEELTSLLREFYGAELLQLIRSLSIRPLDQSNRMEISMDIEAIALDSARRQTTIPWLPNPDEDFQQILSDQVRQINERALFSVYRPPVQERPADPPPKLPDQKYTEAMHTYVAFISDVNGVYRVQLDRRLKGDKLWLGVDDRFEMDGVDCAIREIHFDRITIGLIEEDDSVEETRFSIRLGKCINDFE